MAKLNDYIASLVASITDARLATDVETAKIAEITPSIAAASYNDLSTVWRPAIKDKKPVPRLNHSCTTIKHGNTRFSVWNQSTGSSMNPHLSKKPFK